MEKISSFAKYAVGLASAFCKCADECWQKRCWRKRINLALKKIKLFFISIGLSYLCEIFCSIAHNVLGLCVRAGNRSTKVDIITKFN